MKNLAYILVLFFAFTFGMNAQQTQEAHARSPKQLALRAAKQNTLDAANTLGVDGSVQVKLYNVFNKKEESLIRENITEAEKKQIYANTDTELKAILTKDQVEKLQAAGLYEKMTH